MAIRAHLGSPAKLSSRAGAAGLLSNPHPSAWSDGYCTQAASGTRAEGWWAYREQRFHVTLTGCSRRTIWRQGLGEAGGEKTPKLEKRSPTCPQACGWPVTVPWAGAAGLGFAWRSLFPRVGQDALFKGESNRLESLYIKTWRPRGSMDRMTRRVAMAFLTVVTSHEQHCCHLPATGTLTSLPLWLPADV